MGQIRRPELTPEQKTVLWDRWQRGESLKAIGRAFGTLSIWRTSMAATANKGATRTYFEQVLNRGDMTAADAIFAPDIQFHYPLGDLDGAEAVKSYVAAVRRA